MMQEKEENMSSNLTCASAEASVSFSSSGIYQSLPPHNHIIIKKKRNQAGHPDPDAEVIAMSPRSLMATNRFVCDICNKGFQRDQNLQLHRRGHNLPWKLKQRSSKDVIRKKVYVCPESSCVHHEPARALGDLTGIKKHFCRKHGEKKWKCDKCSKRYAVQSDWKAHSKICGTKEYKCDCGTIFSRRDSFITHRAFCDALAEESARKDHIPFQSSHHQQIQSQLNNNSQLQIKKEQQQQQQHMNFSLIADNQNIPSWLSCPQPLQLSNPSPLLFQDHNPNPSSFHPTPPVPVPVHELPSPHLSATALLQKAAQMGAKSIGNQTHMSSPSSNFSSRDDDKYYFSNGLNKVAGSTASASGCNNILSTSSSFLHDMIMMNAHHPHHFPLSSITTSDEDMPFGSILNHNSAAAAISRRNHQLSFHSVSLEDQFMSRGSNYNGGVVLPDGGVGGGGRNEGMTRDFLGLRPFSQTQMLSITGFSSCINTRNDTNINETTQTPKSWQG